MNSHKCATCAWRQKAEANPRKLSSRLWYWHTRICPGWKAYQRSLQNTEAAPSAADR